MKKQTFEILYKNALEKANNQRENYDFEEVEVALVPVVICKKNGKVASVSSVDVDTIIKAENKF